MIITLMIIFSIVTILGTIDMIRQINRNDRE
jgi:hypothetical protein